MRKLSDKSIIKILETNNQGDREGAFISPDKQYIMNGIFMIHNRFSNVYINERDIFTNEKLKYILGGIEKADTDYKFYIETDRYFGYTEKNDDENIVCFNKKYIQVMFQENSDKDLKDIKSIPMKVNKLNKFSVCNFLDFPIMPVLHPIL